MVDPWAKKVRLRSPVDESGDERFCPAVAPYDSKRVVVLKASLRRGGGC